jgi:hypothetical protein
MTLRETVTGLFQHNASRYLYLPIPWERVVGGQRDTDALVAGRDYFRLWLTEMSLKNDREWFKTWHPAVHSLVHFQFGTQTVDVPNIVGEQGLHGLDAAHLNRSIALNYPLTALMPFSGGVVEVTAALLAIEGQDYLKRFINVLNDFAGLVAVPQLSAVLAVTGPLATGIDELLGGSNGDMHLGLHQSYVHKGGGANELRPAYYAAVLATEAQVDPATLWVVDDRLRTGASAEQSVPFQGFGYVLLRVQKETERDDWEGLTSIMQPFGAAINALGLGHREDAESYYRSALTATINSPDLTKADRRRVAEELSKRFEEAKDLGLGAVSAWPPFADAVASISVDEALAEGEPQMAEFVPDQTGWSPSALGE